jgi:hypothetical protein
MVLPTQALDLLEHAGAGLPLRLESPAEPIPVKKQPKYNPSRWALTGRDDLRANTACWRINQGLHGRPGIDEKTWRELCSLWGSDYRTHITEDRWLAFRDRLGDLDRLAGSGPANGARELDHRGSAPRRQSIVRRDGRWLWIETGRVAVRLNRRRGLAIDGLWFGDRGGPALLGTLPHGYFDDIALGADFYSGLTVVEIPGRSRITDLEWVEWCRVRQDGGDVLVSGEVSTPIGGVRKDILVVADPPSIRLRYEFDWEKLPAATIRTCAVTLHPQSFARSSLFYRTHNGGRVPETFLLDGQEVAHERAISAQVSSTMALGATEGWVEVGDDRRAVRLAIDRTVSAAMPLVTYREVRDSFFYRVQWSLGEYDDTTPWQEKEPPPGICLTIAPAP